jgi:hypothetical protein
VFNHAGIKLSSQSKAQHINRKILNYPLTNKIMNKKAPNQEKTAFLRQIKAFFDITKT